MGTLTEDQDSQDAEVPEKSAPAPSQRPSGSSSSAGGGFFAIRKKGQGYWTRMGTVGGATLIGALTLDFLYGERQTFHLNPDAAFVICTIFLIAYAVGVFYFMNSATSVDFLIATDSEMKKVNWTSREELLGSTKVVILFMFVIAIFLFLTDIFFGYLFYWIGVLKTPPM